MHEVLADRGREEATLVGYWRLQEGGGRLVEDLSGSGIEGAPRTDARIDPNANV